MRWINFFKRDFNQNNLGINQIKELIKKYTEDIIQRTNNNTESIVYIRNKFEEDLAVREVGVELLYDHLYKIDEEQKRLDRRLQYLFKKQKKIEDRLRGL